MWGWRTRLAGPRSRGTNTKKVSLSISVNTGPLNSGSGSFEAEHLYSNTIRLHVVGSSSFSLVFCTLILERNKKGEAQQQTLRGNGRPFLPSTHPRRSAAPPVLSRHRELNVLLMRPRACAECDERMPFLNCRAVEAR